MFETPPMAALGQQQTIQLSRQVRCYKCYSQFFLQQIHAGIIQFAVQN